MLKTVKNDLMTTQTHPTSTNSFPGSISFREKKDHSLVLVGPDSLPSQSVPYSQIGSDVWV